MPRVKFEGMSLEMDVVKKIDAQLKRLPNRTAAKRTLGMVLHFMEDTDWAVAPSAAATETPSAEARTAELPFNAKPSPDPSDPFGD